MNRYGNKGLVTTGQAVDKSGACTDRIFTLAYPQLVDLPATALRTLESMQAIDLKRYYAFTHGQVGT